MAWEHQVAIADQFPVPSIISLLLLALLIPSAIAFLLAHSALNLLMSS
jgi:hypothetical protein